MTQENENSRTAPRTGQVRAELHLPVEVMRTLLGSNDENLVELERGVAVEIHVRGGAMTMTGTSSEVALAESVVEQLAVVAGKGQQPTPDAVRRTIDMLAGGGPESPAEVLSLDILSRRGKTIRPMTLNQKRYVDAIDANTIVFGIGPAGTGKTYQIGRAHV